MRSAEEVEFWKTDWFLGVVVVLASWRSSTGRATWCAAWSARPTTSACSATSREAGREHRHHRDRRRQASPRSAAGPGRARCCAKMTDQLAGGQGEGHRATPSFFREPQVDPGYQYIVKLLDAQKSATQPVPRAAPRRLHRPASAPAQIRACSIVALLKEAEADAQHRPQARRELRQGAATCVQPMLFTLGEPRGRPDKPLPDVRARRTPIAAPKGGERAGAARRLAVRAARSRRSGSVAAGARATSTPTRTSTAASAPSRSSLQYFDQFFPSLSMMIAAQQPQPRRRPTSRCSRGESVSLGKLQDRDRSRLQMYTYFYKDRDGRPAFTGRLVLRRLHAARSRSPSTPTRSC